MLALRKFLVRLVVVCCSALPLLAADQPNIVLIVSDDQGWTDYGFMKHPHIRTPSLDKLASQSLVFPRGYVTTSLCCPSLASIISGLYPHQTKITGNEPPLPTGMNSQEARKDAGYQKQVQECVRFMDELPTVPRELAKRGYLSFQTGKWWQGHFRTGGFTHGMSHGDPEKGGRHGDAGLAIGRKGLQPIYDFINTATSEKKPFFVWYAPMMPHLAHNPPARILEKYKTRTDSLKMAKYWAMCEWFDETCGELLGFLDKNDLAKDTIVVYVTDNGWIQDPDADRCRDDSKLSQYDGGVRTPIMIRWPGHVKPRWEEKPAASIDIAPTLLSVCGVKPGAALQGINLLDKNAVRKRKAIFGECFLHNAVDIHAPAKNVTYRWCVVDDWKLIVPDLINVKEPNKLGRVVETELYNLQKDPFEDRNLATAESKRVAALHRLLNNWWPAK